MKTILSRAFMLVSVVACLTFLLCACDITHTHTPSEWIIDSTATCIESGEKHKECTECGKVVNTEIISATGHSFANGTCSACGADDPEYVWPDDECEHELINHEAKAPTCAEIGWDAYSDCSKCDYTTYIEKTALGHSYINNLCTRCGYEKISEGLKFTPNGDGTCYVSGLGSCSDKDVVIPSISPDGYLVTGIGESAFYNCIELDSITLPDGLTSIGNDAFSGCSLEYNEYDNAYYLGSYINPYLALIKAKNDDVNSCTINCSTRIIVNGAFDYCESLESIIIPDSVTSIGDYTFKNCKNLTNAVVGHAVTNIGIYVFENCTRLKNATLGDKMLNIGYRMFENCYSLESITIPDGVTSIDGGAFENCYSLTNITIPDGVTIIGTHAFKNCSTLTSIHIPNSVTNISYATFSGCRSLTSIDIPNSVTGIDEYAFENCSSLTNITIPNSVTSIRYAAFLGCYNLVEVINKSALNIAIHSDYNGYVAYYAFEVHTGESKIVNIDGFLFYSYNGLDYLVGYVGGSTELTLPTLYNGNNYVIRDHAFYHDNIVSIDIPKGVTSIGDYAFYNCTGLKRVTIGEGVTSIGCHAFEYCGDLNSVIFDNPNGWWYSSWGNFTIPNNGTSIPTNDLVDESMAAARLRWYSNYYWKRA